LNYLGWKRAGIIFRAGWVQRSDSMSSAKKARHGFFQQPTRYSKQALNLRKQRRCVMSKPLGFVTVAMSAAFLAIGMKEYADF
jgi:hypothetical protein